MQNYVINTGDTLYKIGEAFSVTVSELATANQINPAEPLVVGQVMVIPITGIYYWVQQGDTLYKIGQRFGFSAAELAKVNNISNSQSLAVGTRLFIPPKAKVTAEFNAYIEPRGTSVSPTLKEAARSEAPLLTYLAPFSFQIQRDGSLKAPLLDDFPAIATEEGVTLMMVLTNLENDQFSAELGDIILNNQEVQNNLLDNIIITANTLGFKDIHFDLEHLRPEDREAYNTFLSKAADRLHEQGFLMSTALVPKTSAAQEGAWYSAHDYKVHGEVADFVVIMTYEWGYSAGPPMPVSPYGPVRRVLEYALTEIPADKIMMGQNLYGYDWTLPFEPGKGYAKAISPQEAIRTARENKAEIQYDYISRAPYIDYTAPDGAAHKVWFEDGRSIAAKFNLLKELGLRGMSYWKLGLSFPQNWLLLGDRFNVVKR